MKIVALRAYDHYTTTEEHDPLIPSIVQVVGEHFHEDEKYLVLRFFRIHDKEDGKAPSEYYFSVFKPGIIKRVNLELNWEEEKEEP